MTGQIIANASHLFSLDDGLKNTTSQIDSVFADNEDLQNKSTNNRFA